MVENDQQAVITSSGDFVAAMCRQALHEYCVRLGGDSSAAFTWWAGTGQPRRASFSCHRRPHVGVDGVDAVDGLDGSSNAVNVARAGWPAPPSPARRRQGVALGRRDADETPDSRAAARRGGDVVAVADIGEVRPRAARRGRPALVQRRRSAAAWHGCSSLVSALMTDSRGAASASATTLSWPKVRTSARYSQRSRLRATSATVSRAPSGPSWGGTMTSPPSSWTAISKVARVRSDGLSNSRATCWPARACDVGARRPSFRSLFSRAASSSMWVKPAASKSSTDR